MRGRDLARAAIDLGLLLGPDFFLGAQFAQTLQYGARIPAAPTVSPVPRIANPNFSNMAGAFGLGLVLGAFALRPPGGRRDTGLGILHKLYTHLTALR